VNTANDLTAFAVTIAGTKYRGIANNATPPEFVISVPSNLDLNQNAILSFAHNGFGLYDKAWENGVLDVAVANGSTFNFSTENPKSYWVEDVNGTNDAAEGTRKRYVVRIIKSLPVRGAAPQFAMGKKIVSAGKSVDRVSPFGKVKVLTNSHLVIGKISANGSPVDTAYVVAAFVGDELRGKQKVKRVEGQTYITMVVNTVTPDETITFKLWKEGSEVVTFINTLQTIPGGTTGTTNNPYAFNTNAVAGDDVVEPVFINELRTNYPNPFNPTTTIEFSLKENQNVSLEVFNIKGQKVKTLAKGQMEKGRHTIIWNGTNDHGQAVGSGIYFYKMDTKGYNKVRKALLLK